jgi:hypothetical protein
MARHAPDTFASSAAGPTDLRTHSVKLAEPTKPDAAQVIPIAQLAARAAVVAGVLTGLAVGTLLMMTIAGPAPERLQQDAELAGLVRSMVLVKGLILLAALSLVTWRLSRPVARLQLFGYLFSLGVSGAAIAWMWSLNSIPVAAVFFYSGLIGCFYTASRDRFLHSNTTVAEKR